MSHIEGNDVIDHGIEDDRINKDLDTLLSRTGGSGEIDRLDRIVSTRDTREGDGHHIAIGSELGEEAVNEVGIARVTLPHQIFDALTDGVQESLHNVGFEGEIVLGGSNTHLPLAPLAEEGFRADLAIFLDGRNLNGFLTEGNLIQGIESAGRAVLENSGETEVVEVGGFLDARLQTDVTASAVIRQTERGNEQILVVLHIVRKRGNEKIGNSHSLKDLIGLSFSHK